MRLDLVLPNEGDYMLEALNAGPLFEAMGWEGLWLSDHIVGLPEDHLHQQSWTDILIGMAHLAARTSRIRIGSGILVLPYRDPVVTARMLVSLDHLSGGRIDMGVGVGWLKREYEAVGRGAMFDRRGAFTDETLDAILACFAGGTVEFHGEWFDFGPVAFDPKPLQSPRIPLWIGSLGTTGAPIRRAAKYADIWHPSELNTTGGKITPDEYREAGERLDELAGRNVPRTLRLKCDGDPAAVVDKLHRFAEAGCVQAACSFISSSGDFALFARHAELFYEAAASLRGVSKRM